MFGGIIMSFFWLLYLLFNTIKMKRSDYGLVAARILK